MDKEFWFTSEQGILTYHAGLREQEHAAYLERVSRINKTENDMIEALRNSKTKYDRLFDRGDPSDDREF